MDSSLIAAAEHILDLWEHGQLESRYIGHSVIVTEAIVDLREALTQAKREFHDRDKPYEYERAINHAD